MGFNPFDNFGLFSSKKEGGVTKVADDFGQLRQPLIDWLLPQIGQPGKAYQGEMVAPLSDQESKSFDFLRKYGENGFGSTFQQGKNEISKTLSGDYNPATSPYYQAVKAEAQRNLGETQKNIASNAAGAGRYFSGARVKQQGEAASETERGLNTLLGSLSENERQNRLSVLPQAMQYGQAEQQLPLQQATAFQTLGALPRQVQQMLDTAKQNEWQRSEVQYPMDIANMIMGLPISPMYQQNPPSGMSQLLSGAGQGIGQLLPWILMGKI